VAGELKDHSARVLAAFEEAALRAVEESADDLVEKLRERLRGQRTGRLYGSHRASAPGEAPATDTGGLEEATQSRPVSGGMEVYVGDEASYAARFLEWGSPGGKIAPRPWFWPTVEEHRADFTEAVARAIRGVR
jgi:hypothetical protein